MLDDCLSVHRSITLVDFQLDAQNSYQPRLYYDGWSTNHQDLQCYTSKTDIPIINVLYINK